MDQLVNLVPSPTVSKYAHLYTRLNQISFFKKDVWWHEVYQKVTLGAVKHRAYLGITFKVGDVWVFVPDGQESKPYSWYFGTARIDAVAGYLRATNREVTEE